MQKTPDVDQEKSLNIQKAQSVSFFLAISQFLVEKKD